MMFSPKSDDMMMMCFAATVPVSGFHSPGDST